MSNDFLEEGYFYHIYNRGNNKQDIFFETENYSYFLSLLKKHISPVAKVYAYALMSNHYHLLINIRDDANNPSQGFSNFANAYTKAINKKFKRSGSLFQRTFKRKRILDSNYLNAVLIYIHQNPENHGVIDDFRKYEFSSYRSILSTKPTLLEREIVIEWFDSIENFEFVHLLSDSLDSDSEYVLE